MIVRNVVRGCLSTTRINGEAYIQPSAHMLMEFELSLVMLPRLRRNRSSIYLSRLIALLKVSPYLQLPLAYSLRAIYA